MSVGSGPAAYARAGAPRRALRRLAASGPGARVFAPVLHRIDRPVYRLTGGRAMASSLLSGLPVVLLTTTGARSGRPREVPVLGLPVDGGVAVIASNWGRERHPAWLHNLRAHPDCTVTVDGVTRACRAVEAQGERRARIWREGLAVYPGWAAYERRAGGRRIVVFVLEPV